MSAWGQGMFEELAGEFAAEPGEPAAPSLPDQIGARFWYVFDRWLSVASTPTDDENEFVLA